MAQDIAHSPSTAKILNQQWMEKRFKLESLNISKTRLMASKIPWQIQTNTCL